MRRFRRLVAAVLCLCLISVLLSACDQKEEVAVDPVKTIYATFYPFYAAALMLIQDVPDVSLNCLVQPQDGCLRDYQLSDWDLALISTADLVIYGGSGLESFESILYALGEDGPAVSPVLYNMDLMEQKGINTSEDTQSHWLEPNPHIYMQVEGMLEIVQRIASSLILLDAEHEEIYLRNLETAKAELEALREDMNASVSHLAGSKVIVMNEALIYPAREFNLDIDLCYERESGEEIYDADLEACLQLLSTSDAQVILIEKQAPQYLCDALEASGYRVVRMDVLSTKRAGEGSDGYFDALRSNARALKEAFTGANLPS